MPRVIKNFFVVLIIVAIISSLASMVVTMTERPKVTLFEDIVANGFRSAQEVIYTAASRVHSFFARIISAQSNAQTIQELQQKVDKLQQENSRLSELEAENKRLKNMLDFKEANPQLVVSGARVIAKSPGNWFQSFIIDKGSEDGITVDMAVVSDKGLVGRVIDVGSNWSKVMSIIDERNSVSIIIERTRDNGISRGAGVIGNASNVDLLKVLYLPADSEVAKGDVVITSGLGGVFPKGIPVGVIDEVKKTVTGEVEYAMIKPYVDFLRLEEVFVVKAPVSEISVNR